MSLRKALGFLLACIVGPMVFLGISAVRAFSSGESADYLMSAAEVFVVWSIAPAIVVLAIGLMVAEFQLSRRLARYVLIGLLTGVGLAVVLGCVFARGLPFWTFLPLGLIYGIAGLLAYWFVAVRARSNNALERERGQ